MTYIPSEPCCAYWAHFDTSRWTAAAPAVAAAARPQGGAAEWMTCFAHAQFTVLDENHIFLSRGRGSTAGVTALERGKGGFLGGRYPCLVHRAAHNFYDVVMAHHANDIGRGARVGMASL
jgi:hypothetical protein